MPRSGKIIPLYVDDVTGQRVVTNSMMKTFRRCPKQTQYKYYERLKTRETSKPLARGKWMHYLLEAYYKGEGWKQRHLQLCVDYEDLFDEEKEALGDLPTECAALMRSYLWHYGANKDDPHHGWEIVEVEHTLEVELPNGTIYRGRADMLIRDEYGLWLVDHKTHKVLPDFSFRLRDVQSVLYQWALQQQGVEVQGFIWNYLRTKAPTKPVLLKDGSRLSRRAIDTDYPTLVKAIRDYKLPPEDYRPLLDSLKAARWDPGRPQTSSFFHRVVFERNPQTIDQVVREMLHTVERIESYPWDKPDVIERVPDRSCMYSCSFRELCSTELFDGNSQYLRKKVFTHGDPLDYYDDDRIKENEND